MRNRLVHGYFDIDFPLVWDTVRQDIPDLIGRLGNAGSARGRMRGSSTV